MQGDIAFNNEQHQQLHSLARTFSPEPEIHLHLPLEQTTSNSTCVENPFEEEARKKDPSVDPRSDKFDINAWVRSFMDITSRDPERFPGRTAGVSFRDLDVHGVGSPADYQKTVANVWLSWFSMAKGWFGMGGGKHKIQILRDFNGLVKSGELLVVLGRPGSGCSTFLKTIAGQTHGFTVSPTSSLQYQGIPASLMHSSFRGEVIYNAEVDVHFPGLTVGETLLFAAKARVPRTRIGDVDRRVYAEVMRDVVMAVFGLTHTKDTRVGNDFVRGVSGGERKRVSIAEAALSGAPLQCWDNSTRGLDSATALDFIRTLKLSTQVSGSTCMVAIYQPSQAAYDLFDKVIVLYSGHQIYFGSTSSAKAFWTSRGFVCAPRQTTGDFLTSLTNPAERIVQPGWEGRVPRTAEEFAKVWRGSEEWSTLRREIEAYEKEYPLGGDAVSKFTDSRRLMQAKSMSPKSPYTISLRAQVALCMERGIQRLKGNLTNLYITVLGSFVVTLMLSSVFYNLKDDTSSFFSRGSLLFFAALLNAFSSALEIFTLYAQRPIVEKHNAYALYHPFAEAISSMICDLPSKIGTSTGVSVTLYFMSNLRREPGHFFIFYLFSFTCTFAMSMIFRTVGSVTFTLFQALTPAAVLMTGWVMYTGFAVPVVDMVGWLRWINYLNPVAYAFEALMVNEFVGRNYTCSAFVPEGPLYANVSAASQVCSTPGARPGSDFVRGEDYIEEAFSYQHSHLWRNFGILIAFIIVFCGIHLLAVEYISSSKSKGEVLVFTRGHLPFVRADDEEKAAANERPISVPSDSEKRTSDVTIAAQTKVFLWKDVCYDIKLKDGSDRRLLDHVAGWVKPGTLTALMGVSGAGKTTLLDVLAARTTIGVISGSMLVNGHQRDQSFQRKTGYVQQQDLHLATSTVRESLIFSALLRQHKSVPREEKLAYVEEVIALLEMEEYAEAIVGVPGEGLNVEQRKRLTIAVELVAKPQLLLCFDEPTSGLDSQTAWSICQLMRKLANHGQAILSTIHQPSAILMQEFDRLLFLAPGGKTVYFGEIGENSKVLTGYFEKHGAHPCPSEANPAEWMLEVIGAARGSRAIHDWTEVWKTSDERTQVLAEYDQMVVELSQIPDEGNSNAGYDVFAVDLRTQLLLCFHRVWLQYWRTPSYIYAKLVLVTICSLFTGLTFYHAKNTLQGLQNQLFSIFMLLIQFATLSQQIMPLFVEQRALYEARERPSKAYSWLAFLLAQVFVELPWQTLCGVLSFVTWYYPVGFQRNAETAGQTAERGGLMFLYILQFMYFTSTFSQLLVAGLDTAELAGTLAILLFALTLVFCGVLAGPKTLGWWIWMYRVSPLSYLVGGMLSTASANVDVVCSSIELVVVNPDPSVGGTCAEYFAPYMSLAGGNLLNPNATAGCRFCPIKVTNVYLETLNIFYSERWRNFGIFWVYIVFNVAFAVFLYWLGRVPKGKKTQVMVATKEESDAKA